MNSRIMKNYKSTKEKSRLVSEHLASLIKVANLEYSISHATDKDSEEYEKQVKELAQIKGSSTYCGKEHHEAWTKFITEYDKLILICSGIGGSIFDAITIDKTKKKKDGTEELKKSSIYAPEWVGCEKFCNLVSDLTLINNQLLTFPREATENGIDFSTVDGKKKWKLFRDKVAELIQLFTHGDGEFFYGCELPPVKTVAVELFKSNGRNRQSKLKTVNDKSFTQNVLTTLQMYLWECDFVDNFPKAQAEPTPEKTPATPAKRTAKKSEPAKQETPETK